MLVVYFEFSSLILSLQKNGSNLRLVLALIVSQSYIYVNKIKLCEIIFCMEDFILYSMRII